MRKLERSLQLHIAALTAIGGLLLASGEIGMELPVIAVVAAIASHLLVDRLQVVHLTTTWAYLGMGGVAAFCMVDFLSTGPENQLRAVAQLLVLVLVVLLFQRKSQRVFEQIGVFCLLELIVAAVFNSALWFGVLLLPFSLIGLRALVLLQAISTMKASERQDDGAVETFSPQTIESIGVRPRRFPQYGILVLTPSVILIAVLFFYGLPRVGGQSDLGRIGGQQTVGFSESLYLDQVGALLDNPELVMRVKLTDMRRDQRYEMRRPLYLRGQVLESYDFQSGSGKWAVANVFALQSRGFLPEPVYPENRATFILFDEVRVDIDQQPITSETLFSIPSYFEIGQQTGIEHVPGRWILRQSQRESGFINSRVHYSFGTHAMSNGLQNRFVRYRGAGERMLRARNDVDGAFPQFPGVSSTLLNVMTEFNPEKMPSVVRETEKIVQRLGEAAASPNRIAEAVELYLATDPSFSYTTDLSAKRNRKIDPIEEFLSSYRAGHCQYFASAMVMMLRGQGIPARVVVGYKTDELNSISGHYIVRQLHAHAWVEALIAEDDLPVGAMMLGQPTEGPVLVRFDPTPGSNVQETQATKPVRHFYDFAQTLWNSYVLDMNSQQQSEAIFGRDGGAEFSNAYNRLVLQLEVLASRINTGQLGAGALSASRLFSWRAASLGIIGTLIMFGLYQLGLPRWLGRRWFRRRATGSTQVGSRVAFFERLCDLLAQRGLTRAPGVTPKELVDAARPELTPASVSGPPLTYLLDIYYRIRYGDRPPLTAEESAAIDRSLNQIESLVQK
jgi:transglutaminase-like putative cysteine protease